jgi:sulfate transport system ATP-binding protein
MSFIGPVNVLASNSAIFQGNGLESNNPQMFLRPQDIVIEIAPNGTNVPARVNRIIHLGWEIQAELSLADGQIIMAHLTRDRFDDLQLQPQQNVYVQSKEAKSFPPDYFI